MSLPPPRTYGKVEFQSVERLWALTCEPHAMIRLKAVFPRVNKAEMGVVHLKDSPKTCSEILWFMAMFPLSMSPADKRRLVRGRKRDRATMVAARQTITGELVPRLFQLGLTPRAYQAVGTELLLRRKALLVTDEMGLGKTLLAIAAFTQKESLPALVVVKVGLIPQWGRELQRCLPGIRVHVIPGTQVGPLPPADVYLTSYTRLAAWAETLAPLVNSVVFDEAHELRHRDTAKYSGAQFVARSVESRGGFRGALTGTPVYNLGNEMFSILDLLEEGCLGDYEEFAREWCESWGRNDRVRDSKALGAYLLDQGLMLRRTRQDVQIELPPRTRLIETIETDTAALLKDDSSAIELAKIILTSPSFTLKGQAAREFDIRLRQATGIAKAPAVAAFARLLLESTSESIIIAAWHREVYDVLQRHLHEFKPVLFTGSETAAQKEASLTAFKKGESRVLFMSLRSVEGLDGLQSVCATVIHAELDYSPMVHEQTITRVDRPGQTRPTLEVFLLSAEGSDPTVARINGVKREQSEGILNPTGQATTSVVSDAARVKSLARDFLKQRGVAVQEPDDELFSQAV